jgi:hypothetical protein
VTISFGGGIALLSREWTSNASFSNWAGWTDMVEPARLESSHDAGSGPSYAAAIGLRMSRRLGLSFAAARSDRDATARIEMRLPHPFLLDRPRAVQGEARSLSYRETAVHFDTDWRPVLGRFELTLFAGPSLLRVETDAIDGAQAQDEYPYDAPSFRSAHSVVARSDLTLGWNAGASGAWVATRHLDLGLEARYTSASVDLRPSGVEAFRLNAGGLQVTTVLRLRF